MLAQVWASYPATRETHRLIDVDLVVEAGQICAVLGPNGAGKSTLVKVIAATLAPTRGRVLLSGRDVHSLTRIEIARQVAVVAQHTEVALGFTVREVVEMGRSPHQGAWQRSNAADREAVDRALELTELEALAHRPVSTLSGGEQGRVHIARALAQQAPILVLDEAAAHLDVRHGLALYELIRHEVEARQLGCVAVMHDLNAAAAHADRVLLLKQGRVVAHGPIDEVMTAAQLDHTFDAEIHTGLTQHGRRYFLPIGPQRTAAGEPGGGAR